MALCPVIAEQRWQSDCVRHGGIWGQAIGNLPIYELGEGWEKEMENHASRDMARLYELLSSRAWHKLVPDQRHEVLVANCGTFDGAANQNDDHAVGFDYATTARASGKAVTQAPGERCRRTRASEKERLAGESELCPGSSGRPVQVPLEASGDQR